MEGADIDQASDGTVVAFEAEGPAGATEPAWSVVGHGDSDESPAVAPKPTTNVVQVEIDIRHVSGQAGHSTNPVASLGLGRPRRGEVRGGQCGVRRVRRLRLRCGRPRPHRWVGHAVPCGRRSIEPGPSRSGVGALRSSAPARRWEVGTRVLVGLGATSVAASRRPMERTTSRRPAGDRARWSCRAAPRLSASSSSSPWSARSAGPVRVRTGEEQRLLAGVAPTHIERFTVARVRGPRAPRDRGQARRSDVLDDDAVADAGLHEGPP